MAPTFFPYTNNPEDGMGAKKNLAQSAGRENRAKQVRMRSRVIVSEMTRLRQREMMHQFLPKKKETSYFLTKNLALGFYKIRHWHIIRTF